MKMTSIDVNSKSYCTIKASCLVTAKAKVNKKQ